MTWVEAGKQLVVSDTLPFCYHLVQNPVADWLVQVETEFIANVAEFTHTSSNPRANNARMDKDIVNFVSYL